MGASIELKPLPAHAGEWTAWLALVETSPWAPKARPSSATWCAILLQVQLAWHQPGATAAAF
jgi:hypothetical protein